MSITSIDVDLLTEATNNAVVRLPNRKYPGVLIQGDSLYALFVELDDLAMAASSSGADPALVENALAVRDNVGELLAWYEQALTLHGMSLPHSHRDA